MQQSTSTKMQHSCNIYSAYMYTYYEHEHIYVACVFTLCVTYRTYIPLSYEKGFAQ